MKVEIDLGLTLSPHTTMKSSWQGLWATEMTLNGTVAVLSLCTQNTHTYNVLGIVYKSIGIKA